MPRTYRTLCYTKWHEPRRSPYRRPRTLAVATRDGIVVPRVIADAGDQAARRFLEFFAATIRNKNTRMAYYRAVVPVLRLVRPAPDRRARRYRAAARRGLYRGAAGSDFEKPTVKQHLAAIRMLFDWLVTGQVVATNPAHAVRGPKHVVKTGKTPVLDAEQARELLDSIDTSTVVGLRDRALIAVMTFAFARIGAVVAMRVEDYYPKGKRWWVRLHEKGGKRHEMPAHHNLEAYLDAYIEAAGIRDDGKSSPLPLRRRPHRHADRKADAPRRRLAHDPAPRRRARHARQDRLPHVSRDRHHRLSRSRRHARKRAGDGGARKPAHDQALRPHRRRDHAR